MNEQPIECKYCHSTAVVKYGTFEGMQRYFCKSCQRKFADNDALPRMKTPVWVIASALSQYYDGKSLSTIQNYLNSRYGAVYAKSSIYYWVLRFSREAVALSNKFQPEIGDILLACESTMLVGTHKIWFWDVIDARSSYLISSHLSLKPENFNAGNTADEIRQKLSTEPSLIIFTRTGDNGKKSETVWYKSSKDILNISNIMQEAFTGTVERFQTTLKIRSVVLRGYKNLKTASLLTDTWQVHYNFFISFTGIGHTPPARKMTNPPFNTWLDVINLSTYKNNLPPKSLLGSRRSLNLRPESFNELPLKGKYR